MSYPDRIEKEVPSLEGIKYLAWEDKALKKYPIDPDMVGQPVRWASEPNSKNFRLLSIKRKGEKQYPDGGYHLQHPDYPFGISVYLDEAIAFPKPRSKSSSQLSRVKKQTTRKTKTNNPAKRKRRSKKK